MFYSCNKTEESAISTTNKQTSNNNLRMSKDGSIDSLAYFAKLISPVRDIANFDKMTGTLPKVEPLKYDPVQQAAVAAAGGGGNNGDCYYLPECNGISFPLQSGWSCTAIPGTDTFGNAIHAYGKYGTDPRQRYYVNYPANKNANSPIVVLIHGGAWFMGPNPDNIQGCTFGFTDNKPNNLVKNLLDNGYVVVTVLYRLVKYGNNNTEILSNTTTIQNQIDDIDAAIVHVRNNFPTCLGINANSIQILGESAGGHLALMWAYTKATISSSYIKSVISCYAPTNLQQYGNYLQGKATGTYTCGTDFNVGLNTPYFPFYFPVDITNTFQTYNANTLTCIPKYFGNLLSNFRILDSYNIIQSAVATVIPTPSTNSVLNTYSPKNALNSSRIIPTYIMHSDASSDKLVPYNQSTNDMSTKLTSTGGLISTINNNNLITYNYTTQPNKHLIQLFPGANHTWGNTTSATKDNIRANIVQWFNGHK